MTCDSALPKPVAPQAAAALYDGQGLYRLLPAIYQIRDAERGYPLRALLEVIGEQVALVEADLDRLYDNWFIETCDPWVVPYLGDVVGLHRHGPQSEYRAAERAMSWRQPGMLPRREVANVIRDSRRKGTRKVLEELTYDVAGWRARATELYPFVTQFSGAWSAGEPWSHFPRFAELERGGSPRGMVPCFPRLSGEPAEGRVEPHAARVALSVWRQQVYSHRETTPHYRKAIQVKSNEGSCDGAAPTCVMLYAFHPLGFDTPLFARPEPGIAHDEQDVSHLPLPLGEANELLLAAASAATSSPNCLAAGSLQPLHPKLYGSDSSLCIWQHHEGGRGRVKHVFLGNLADLDRDVECPPGQAIASHVLAPTVAKALLDQIAAHKFSPADDWAIVDPALGLLLLPDVCKIDPYVTYHYAFSGDLGGGEYRRPPLRDLNGDCDSPLRVHRVLYSKNSSLDLRRILCDYRSNSTGNQATLRAQKAVQLRLLFCDSEVYTITGQFLRLFAGDRLELCAAADCRPTIRLSGDLRIRFSPNAHVRFSGVTLGDGKLIVEGRQSCKPDSVTTCAPSTAPLAPDQRPSLVLHHATLLAPRGQTDPALTIALPDGRVSVQHSIVGPILTKKDVDRLAPADCSIRDSIVGCLHDSGCADAAYAILGSGALRLNIARSTIFGRLHARELILADNSIFTGPLTIVRRQDGGMRFCYVPPHGSTACGADCDSRVEPAHARPQWDTPRQFYCQPGLWSAQQENNSQQPRSCNPSAGKGAALRGETDDVCEQQATSCALDPYAACPHLAFTSQRYGDPGLAQLSAVCAVAIRRGADDGSEMGVFHDLFIAQRERNLRERIDDFTPVGMDVVLRYEN
ncbi:MAG: hypothetical protein K1X74_16625 [Pirellulales bacterium]|nr:hypothetical protein [Pirellulales bacterium]